MKLSTKGRYAITAMIEIALRDKQGPVTLAEISQEQNISVSYLEQLFARLRKAGLVVGLRGPGGGYCLRRPASEVSIADVLRCVDDADEPARQRAAAQAGDLPLSLKLWETLSQDLYQHLDGISLADVVRDHRPAMENHFRRSAA